MCHIVGVFGYSWVVILHVLCGLSFKGTLLLANISSIAWLAVYFLMLESPEKKQLASRALLKTTSGVSTEERDASAQAADSSREPLPEGQDFPLLRRKGKQAYT